MKRLKDLLLSAVKIFQRNKMPVYTSYATLYIVTAIFPFIILIISVVNLLPWYSTKDVATVLFQILPDLGPIKELVVTLITDLKDQSGGLLASVAAITTLWSASKGVSAIQTGLNQLDLNRPENSPDGAGNALLSKGKTMALGITKRVLFTLMLVILIPALLVFQMLGGSIADIIQSIISKLDLDVLDSTLSKIDSFFNAGFLVVIVLAFVVILLIYAVLPNVRRTLKSQIPGALLTGVCWFVFTALFSYFIPRFYNASNVYGSLASLFLLLLWLRYMIMILFAGAAVNHAVEEEGQAKT